MGQNLYKLSCTSFVYQYIHNWKKKKQKKTVAYTDTNKEIWFCFQFLSQGRKKKIEVLQSTAEVAKDKYYVDCYPVWEVWWNM